MKKKKTTILDIAHHAKVTPATVSRALRDHPRISSDTKKLVKEIAEKLNYHPNNIATALRNGKSNIIGVMVPTSDRNFFASVIRGIDEVVKVEGYNLIICQSDDQFDKEQLNIESLLKIQVEGIIASVAKGTTNFKHFQNILERNIPLIFYDRVDTSIDASVVVSDDYLGAYKAVTHLISQGCKRIIHFAGWQHINIYQDRLRGYKDALKEHNLPVDEKLILELDLIKDTDRVIKLGRETTKKILQMPELPDAIFSSSDFAAMGAIQELKKNKIQIPKEIALVGYSNDFSTSIIEPSLSSIDQHTIKMGNLAAQLFLEEVKTSKRKLITRKTLVNPKLIVRESSRRK